MASAANDALIAFNGTSGAQLWSLKEPGMGALQVCSNKYITVPSEWLLVQNQAIIGADGQLLATGQHGALRVVQSSETI
jgi:hypothetical protein